MITIIIKRLFMFFDVQRDGNRESTIEWAKSVK